MQLNFLQHDALGRTAEIAGLSYIPNYISEDEEAALLASIDQQTWLSDLKRRVQHYGWKYDYSARRVNESMRLGSLPQWLSKYCQRLYQDNHFTQPPDQVIVNEYQPGQGISAHIDCVPCFGETVVSLSLSSPCIMEFSRANEKISMLLEPRSLLILSGDARYEWKHAIPARKTDKVNGITMQRGRRVSLTFRAVLV